jgi:hypothetical protein
MLEAVARIADAESDRWVLHRHEKSNNTATPAQTLRGKRPARGTELQSRRIKTSLTITEAVLMAAVRNDMHAEEIITALLEHTHGTIEITEAIFAASLEVQRAGPGRYMDYNVRYRPDPWVMEKDNPLATTELLFRRPGTAINVTEAVLLKALKVGYCIPVLRSLPPMSVSSSTVTEAVLVEAADCHRGDNSTILTFLLKAQNTNIHVTESLPIAAERKGDAEMMAFLLEQTRDKSDIPPGLLLAATSNIWNGGSVLEVLLKHPTAATRVTQTVLLRTVARASDGSRWRNYAEILGLILNHPSAKLEITDVVIKEAASNENINPRPVASLLGNVNAKIQITEEIMLAAARNQYKGAEMLTILLKHQSVHINETEAAPNNTHITAAVVAAAAAHSQPKEIIPLLFKQLPNVNHVITEDVLKCAACNEYHGRDALLLLLKEPGANIYITEAVLAAAARNMDREVMIALLEQRRENVEITEAVLVGAAGSFRGAGNMSLLLNTTGRNSDVTEAVLVEAASNKSYSALEIMPFLLNTGGISMKITEAVLVTAASNESLHAQDVIALLLKSGGLKIKITEAVLVAAASNEHDNAPRLTALLLNHENPNVKTTETVLPAAPNTPSESQDLLIMSQSGITPPPTQAAQASSFPTDNGIEPTELILLAALGNTSYRYARSLTTLILKHSTKNPNITTAILVAAVN